MYKCLEEMGLKPDVVVGTSIGAEVNQADNSKDCPKVILAAPEIRGGFCCATIFLVGLGDLLF